LDGYFTDIDSSLSYSVVYGGNMTIQIDNFEGTATIIPDANFTGESWARFIATDLIYSVSSNNATVRVVLGPSILKNTRINGTLYPDGNYTNLTGILVSNLTNAHVNISNLTSCRVEDSSIINATLEQCTIINSLVKNYIGYNCIVEDSTVDPPTIPYDITGSNITGGSVIYESDVINSDVDSSNITGSAGKDCTISNSYVRNCDFLDCVILNGIVYGGEITFNGSTYDADTAGETNLTNIINYPPAADFTVSSSLKPNTSIEFNSTTEDANIYNGISLLPLNDSLSYFWNFSDGNTSTAPSLARNFTSEGEYNVTLTVTDKFGEYSSAIMEFTISEQPVSPPSTTRRTGGGGGGGRRTTICTESWNCTAWDPCTPYGIQYRTCIDANQCGTFLYMPVQDQACEYTPTCTDFFQNQDETDVDCGGICSPCRNEMMCVTDDDCQNSCIDGICGTKPEPTPVVTPPVRPRLPPPPPVIERPTGMQAVLAVFTKQLLGVEVWAYLLAVFLTIIFVMGGAMAGKYRAKRLREIPTYSYYDALKTAIRRDVERGVPEMDIKNALLGGGWPEHIINQAIVETNNMILQPAVEKDITKGYDETKLKKALLNKGWPKSRVSEVMSDSNMEMLRRAMEENFAKGYSANSIGKEMKKMGWPKEMVDHIVNEFKYLK